MFTFCILRPLATVAIEIDWDEILRMQKHIFRTKDEKRLLQTGVKKSYRVSKIKNIVCQYLY